MSPACLCLLVLLCGTVSAIDELTLHNEMIVVRTVNDGGVPSFVFWRPGSSKTSTLMLSEILIWSVSNAVLMESTCAVWEETETDCDNCQLDSVVVEEGCSVCINLDGQEGCDCKQVGDNVECTCTTSTTQPCSVATFSLSSGLGQRWSSISFDCAIEVDSDAPYVNATMSIGNYTFVQDGASLVVDIGVIFPSSGSVREDLLYYEKGSSFLLAADTSSIGTSVLEFQDCSGDSCASGEETALFSFSTFVGGVSQKFSFGLTQGAAASPSGNWWESLGTEWKLLIGVGVGFVCLSVILATAAVMGFYYQRLQAGK